MECKPKRLLFFDLLRITSVTAIVLLHIAQALHWPYFSTVMVYNLLQVNCGIIGVYILIFVSGAVLEYSHPHLDNFDEVATFYVKRLSRIYPAFWMSLILGLTLSPVLIHRPPLNTFLEFTGFNTWSGHWGGLINPCGWFIGLIVTLYFVYPFLSASIKKYPYQMLFMITIVEVLLRWFLDINFIPALGIWPSRWLPVCYFLEFGLGIWIVQQDVFPKWRNNNRTIGFLADISFYVFLVHLIAGMEIQIAVSLPFYLISISLLAWLLMLGDRKAQAWLKKVIGYS